ncbi:NAD(P)/FAD-dependent oxidoreductase [Pseudarthrobacter sp. 1C304]|uniref:NAD(P)/FAD-dependent oxidoreductase n=1 Tax=Pseudarthrobacter sp. 1C304 TaxID=3457438 RepID=UPI003FD4D092
MVSGNIVIVGGGLAGATAAKTLRAEGYSGPVILLAEEGHPPYLRPPLSKDYLLGRAGEEALPVVPDGWYEDNGVELRLAAAAAAVDPGARRVTLRDGRTLDYSSLLLATGARPRRIPVPGSDLDGVSTFRTVDDSRRLREGLAGGGRKVVMIGSGWIGLELAAAASAYGNAVTLLGLEQVPLEAAVGRELGGFFRSLHEDHGVRFRLPASAAAIKGQSGRVTGVETDAGEVLPADLVIIAVGVVPEVALADAAGIALRNGILTDASLRTSAPGVFAAGDVANALHPYTGEHHRSEHWANALAGGKVAARAMLGMEAALDAVPYFYTDQFDVSMEYSGFASLASGPPTVRGSFEAKEFLAFWQREGRVVAGMSVNWPRSAKPQQTIKQLINTGTAVSPADLADPGVPLGGLVPAA